MVGPREFEFSGLHCISNNKYYNDIITLLSSRFKLNTVGSPSERTSEYSVWVGDLDPAVDDETLFQHFASRYTSTTAAKVVCDKNTGMSRGESS